MQHGCHKSRARELVGPCSFLQPFRATAIFVSLRFQRPANANGDGAVTRGRDMPPSKKSLPALDCPSTLPNKVAIQRQPSRDPR